MVGDPAQIRVVAARLRAEGERVRWLARRVLATGDVSWQSPAAALFRVSVAELAEGVRRCAPELDEAARRVEAHAEAVAVARAELASVLAGGVPLGAALAGRVAGRG